MRTRIGIDSKPYCDGDPDVRDLASRGGIPGMYEYMRLRRVSRALPLCEMRDSLSAAHDHAAESGLGCTEYSSVVDCVRTFDGR